MPKAVLWDLDGTLVDSGEFHWRAWRETMRSNGVEISHEQFLATFGWRNDAILKNWLGPNLGEQDARRIGDAKEAHFRQLVRTAGITALPGAAEWVRRLSEAGWRQAIASSAPRANVEAVLEALTLAQHFQAIVSAEDVQRGKPDPEVFIKAAARVGSTPAESIVVEDAAMGIEAARRARMRSIGVTADGTLPANLSVPSLLDLLPDAFDWLLAKQRAG
jgi:HAD superfamily hydrolase (TIGR01509 family)